MEHFVEEDSGTFVPRRQHPHNGYYAGDFSTVPFREPDLHSLLGIAAHAA
jgi:hypothetical protein